MKSLYILLKNIRNLLPYLILIAIYFFFVNLEAGKEKVNNRTIEKENNLHKNMSTVDETQFRLKIPVIPYNQ
tara:strand:- start:2239 stop:2454 length:216 start_codon:yes stop_codon:yes gene_type:complete